MKHPYATVDPARKEITVFDWLGCLKKHWYKLYKQYQLEKTKKVLTVSDYKNEDRNHGRSLIILQNTVASDVSWIIGGFMAYLWVSIGITAPTRKKVIFLFSSYRSFLFIFWHYHSARNTLCPCLPNCNTHFIFNSAIQPRFLKHQPLC